MNKKLALIVMVVIIFLLPLKANQFTAWEDVFEILQEYDKAVEITDIKKNKYIEAGKKINQYIINRDIESLRKLFFEIDDFRYYFTKGDKTGNIIFRIRNAFKKKEGFDYDTIFNKINMTKNSNKWHSTRGNVWGVLEYLKEYDSKLEWRVFFISEDQSYDVWFSIPNDLIVDFSYFHYRFKEINGKLVLIGF